MTVPALLNIALEKEGEKNKTKVITLLSRRKVLLSLWYIDSTVNAFFEISKMRKGKLEKYENENYYLFW